MHKKHLLLAIMVTAVWGLNFPVTKLGLVDIDALLLTALRFALAALPWVFFVERPRIAFRWLAAYGLIFGVAMWALINQGIAWGVPPGTASLLIQCSAFFTLGWGVIFFRERLGRPQLLGALLAAAGLLGIVLCSPGDASRAGLALVIGSAMAWSVGNVIIKVSKVREIFAFVVWASLFPPIPLMLLTWTLHGSAPFIALPAQLNTMTLVSLAFQVYAATHFSYWGWNLLLREYPISRVAPLSLLIPVFGIFSSMAILGQHPSPAEWGLILLVLAAIVLGSGYLQGLLSRRRARIA
ncbi:O-acetylserine/cysteine efflux transporter [Pseudomonas helmanticensis]|uniref:O-acetylserine/cysteine efflux transporter n=1 Tax=Pseudomonas helmanticensis TaxID=1471381 RepID=A0ACD2U0X7_9PSED|nr:EamA family transporter [Pseudomonas helmanticensis]SMQ23138.1 O-acetylserine/cysteine efflux transporter [Pseudomonas helmanticensis]